MRTLRWFVPGAFAVAGWLAAGSVLLPVPAAKAQSLAMEPALLAGEQYALTQNGCGVVINNGGSDSVASYETQPDGTVVTVQRSVKDYVAQQQWTGDCNGGLAHGWGKFGPPTEYGIQSEFWPDSEFAYGRELGRSRSPTGQLTYISRNGDSFEVMTFNDLGETATDAPKWVSFEESTLGGSSISTREINVRTNATNCYTDTERFRGCNGEGYAVYGVTVQTLGPDGKVENHWCPRPKTAKGCEALWQELAGPTVAQVGPMIAAWQQRTDAAVQQYAELSKPWLAEANARAAAKLEAERAAAAAAAQAVAEAEQLRLQQAEAAAAAFAEQLATANAGELFLLAQDLEAAGRHDDAQLARRALISNFPDNAMAATAAEQLVATQAAPPSASAALPAGIERCQQAENASSIPAQMAGLPADNVNLQTRGIVVAADFMIATYSACLPDAQAQAIVDDYRATRESALATCRAVSTVDNCEIPPFGPAYEADLQRQQEEAARLQAEYEAAEDNRELDESLQNLMNVIEQLNGDGSDSADYGGDECTFNSDADPTTVCTAQ